MDGGKDKAIDKEQERRKISLRKIRRNRKLLVQVGLIISGIFIVVIAVTALILTTGNIRTYLQSKEEYMRPLATRQQINFDEMTGLSWFLDMWEEYPDVQGYYIEPSMDNPEYVELIETFPIDGAYPTYDPETLDNYPLKQRLLLAAYMYYDIYIEQMLSYVLMENLTSMVVDVRDEHWGTSIMVVGDVYKDFADDEQFDMDTQCGLDYSEFLNDLKGAKKVKETGTPMFERYDSPKDGNYYYLYITPILDNGVVTGEQILAYDWSSYHSSLVKRMLLVVGISTLVLALAALLLLFFINRSAIRPLSKVQRGVREYMETKDSWKAFEHMKDIKQRNEFGVLADDVTKMTVEIDRYTDEVTALTRDRERVEAELSLAADIQKGFLPGEFPEASDYELYASMDPAKEVGGDLYDFFDIDPTHVGLVIGDVSGKGVPASLFMMIAKVLIREYARTGLSPAEVLSKANQTLCANNKNDMFVTAWFGILDRESGKVVAASAGHEFPLLQNAGEGFRLIKDRHGFVLGGMEMSKYREYELELGKGGTLFVYTDGAPEATNAHQELFGTDRMLEALNSHSCEHPREVIDTMDRAIAQFVGNAPQFDDLTMLCVKYNGQ